MKINALIVGSLFYSLCFVTFATADECYTVDCSETSSFKGQFYANADWLYMKAQQDSLSAGSFVDDFPDPILKTVDAKFLESTFTFQSGVRANLGYQPDCSLWQFEVNYSYQPFCSKPLLNIGTGNTNPDNPQFISTNSFLFPILTVFPGYISQRTKWHGNFSYVDVDCCRTIAFADCFRLRPHIGFRMMWMDQTYSVDGELIEPSINDSTFSRVKMHQKFQGYGIEGGVFGDLALGSGFSLVGHIGGSILYSHFNVNFINKGFLGEDGALTFLINAKEHVRTATPTLEYFAGLQYEVDYQDTKIAARVGWEQRVFFNLNRLSIVGGNFSVQGLNVGLSMTF